MNAAQGAVSIHILRCGAVGTDETIPDRSRSGNPFAYTGLLRGARHRVWLPVFAYLIEHPQGRILVDTGWHTAVRENRRKHLSWQLDIASKAVLPEGEAVTEQLAARGLSPARLDLVLLTHMDVDHASGLALVRDAQKICAHPAELEAVRRGALRYSPKLWAGIPIEPLAMEVSDRWPNGRGWDVFGDGSVQFVDLSGHSAGMTGVLVQNRGRFALLTGDACYNRRSWEQGKLPGIMTDRAAAERSIRWVAELAKRPDCAAILASHDPEITPHTITL